MRPIPCAFIPVKFYTVNCTIFQAYGGNPFQLAPTPLAESSLETVDLADTRPDGIVSICSIPPMISKSSNMFWH